MSSDVKDPAKESGNPDRTDEARQSAADRASARGADASESRTEADAGTPATGEEVAAEADTATTESAETAVDPLEQALARIQELEDQSLRSSAEAQNVRRRAALDVANARKFALERFAQSLLPIVDSLEKAVEVGAGEDASGPLAEGVGISLRMFLDVLAKENITQVDPLGEPFDPQLHEAMTLVDNPEVEPNSVVSVLQKGFVLHGRLVRPAMVVVSRPASQPATDQQP